jgi:hypothetical protein
MSRASRFGNYAGGNAPTPGADELVEIGPEDEHAPAKSNDRQLAARDEAVE